MRNICTLALIGLFLLSLSSCKKEIELPNENLKDLFGEWQWVSSTGGISGSTQTPQSVGYEMTYEFTNKGVHKYYKGNVEQFRVDYEIIEQNNPFTGQPGYLIDYQPDGDMPLTDQFVEVSGDELTLYDNCIDCFTMKFERK